MPLNFSREPGDNSDLALGSEKFGWQADDGYSTCLLFPDSVFRTREPYLNRSPLRVHIPPGRRKRRHPVDTTKAWKDY